MHPYILYNHTYIPLHPNIPTSHTPNIHMPIFTYSIHFHAYIPHIPRHLDILHTYTPICIIFIHPCIPTSVFSYIPYTQTSLHISPIHTYIHTPYIPYIPITLHHHPHPINPYTSIPIHPVTLHPIHNYTPTFHTLNIPRTLHHHLPTYTLTSLHTYFPTPYLPYNL